MKNGIELIGEYKAHLTCSAKSKKLENASAELSGHALCHRVMSGISKHTNNSKKYYDDLTKIYLARLIKTGALIAAEIDRLIALEKP